MNGEMSERSSTGAPSKASDARTPVRRRLSRDSSKSTSALRRMFTDARRTIHRSLGLNDAEAEEKKCLVLHGWRSNASVSAVHVRRMRLFTHYSKVHCVKGTMQAPSAANEATGELYDGPWYSWVDNMDCSCPEHERIEALLIALRSVVRFVLNHGPYRCAVGFSQGGALISLLSNKAVLRALGVESGFLWDRSVVCCGASSSLVALAEKALGIDSLANSKSALPSLHIFGFQDKFKPQGETLMETFETFDGSLNLLRHCLYFDAGHTVPASLETDAGFTEEVRAWCKVPSNAGESTVFTPDVDQFGMDLDYTSLKYATVSDSMRREMDIERGEVDSGERAQTNTTTYATIKSLCSDPEQAQTRMTPSDNKSMYDVDAASLLVCETKGDSREHDVLEFLSLAPKESPLLYDLNGARMTYGQAIDFITKGDGDLRNIGVHQGSILAYNVPPGSVGALAFLAVAAQCIAVPLDPGIAEEDAFEALTSCRVSIVALFRGTGTDSIEKAATRANIPIKWFAISNGGNDQAVSYAPEAPEAPSGPVLRKGAEEVGLLLRTSGTTSKSKVVPLHIRSLTNNGSTLSRSLELKAADVCINSMPLFHIGGLSCSILATIAAHASVICCPKFNAQEFYDAITTTDAVKPTWYSAIPTIHLAVVQYGTAVSRGTPPVHSLRFIRSGAAALSHADAQKLHDFWGCPIIPTYSMSEQMPISGKNVNLSLEDRPDTVGQPLSCSLALVGDGHCRLTAPFGQRGELSISSCDVMSAYQDADEANNKTYFYLGDKRFLRTGDIAKMDKDGFIYLTGRSKELIKRGGEQVSPLKVEAVMVQHRFVRVAVVFSVPSPLWGEEVGAAIVLEDDYEGEEATALSSVKSMMNSSKELSRFEIPVYWKIVAEDDLPKTSTKKYKRGGLAEILGIGDESRARACSFKSGARSKPAATSPALGGLRYCMAVGVMFNHIGAVWQGEDERNPLTYGPAWWSAKATTFYFPATTFFVLGGYTLSAALNGKEVKQGTWLSFYNSRYQNLFPLYLLSLLFGLINVLVVCRPSTFSSEFSWQPHPDTLMLSSGKLAQCQTGPVEMPYGAWLFSTIVVFSLGLQTWFPLWLLSSWFMYYTWFNGVYYFVILVFPVMHNALARVKGDLKAVNRWFIIYSAAALATGALLGLYYAFPSWKEHEDVHKAKSWKENAQNIYALSTMMFPPYWIPCVGTGMVGYFWFDAVRPAESHRRVLYGRITDALTLTFFAFHLAHFLDENWPYPTKVTGKMWEVVPEEHHNWATGIKRYVWSVMITRLYSPLIAVWVTLVSIPRGSVTTRFLESNLLTEVLGPTSYGCFLFHQIIGQWYWWATRVGNDVPRPDVGDKTSWSWWAYPKEYYWFSPQPLPVAWYEFFFVVGLVTCFSAAADRLLTTPLTVMWVKFINFFQNIIWPGSVHTKGAAGGQLPAEERVIGAVAALTGVAERISLDDSFDEIGLVSVGLPVLVGLINASEPMAVISAQEIAHCQNLRGVVDVIERKRMQAQNSTGVGRFDDRG